jgi:hypothetical protein
MTEEERALKIAPEGQVFICAACGKRSRDIYGDQKIDRGWDESCFMNRVLMDEQTAADCHTDLKFSRCVAWPEVPDTDDFDAQTPSPTRAKPEEC